MQQTKSYEKKNHVTNATTSAASSPLKKETEKEKATR